MRLACAERRCERVSLIESIPSNDISDPQLLIARGLTDSSKEACSTRVSLSRAQRSLPLPSSERVMHAMSLSY